MPLKNRETSEQLSRRMAAVRQRNTTPELMVRRIAHELGFRFRLHSTDLPGRPDIVFRRLKTVIFVHGCFWHRHRDCCRASIPATRQEYWRTKFRRTEHRDRDQAAQLRAAGWNVEVVWECETKKPTELRNRLRSILESRS